jgi:predicted nuclease of predicted toxin-antitoxin system
VRFLVDECLSVKIAQILATAGHDALHVSQAGLQGHSDETVITYSRSEDRVLLTADTDFGELLSRSGESFPSVIILRRSSRIPEQQAAIVLTNLPDVEPDLVSGALIVFNNSVIRVRRLPIQNR